MSDVRRGPFLVSKDPLLGEEVWMTTTSKGLPLRVVPSDRFQEIAAMITFGYGSIDLGFEVGGRKHGSPEGVAHYLEHKLFEDESLHTFERFARRGARVNAMTGFGRTSYYFTATSALEENLQDLLHLVSRVHLTPENVEKERGIIAQELRMYEDNPDYRAFFAWLNGLYQEHPVRHPVGGTVASIARIDVDELLRCYHAFYRTGNAALGVAGAVDPMQVLALAEACTLPSGAPEQRFCPLDLGPAIVDRAEVQLNVQRPRVLLGFKDRTIVEDADERLTRDLTTRILLDRLFGLSSAGREKGRRLGRIDDTMSAGYISDRTFGILLLSCETEDPDATAEYLREMVMADVVLTEEDLEPVRRKQLGHYVRSFEQVKNLAFTQAGEALDGVAPFGALPRMQAITAEMVAARRRELCVLESSSMLVVTST